MLQDKNANCIIMIVKYQLECKCFFTFIRFSGEQRIAKHLGVTIELSWK